MHFRKLHHIINPPAQSATDKSVDDSLQIEYTIDPDQMTEESKGEQDWKKWSESDYAAVWRDCPLSGLAWRRQRGCNKQFSITKRSAGDGATIAPAAASESLNPIKGITIQTIWESLQKNGKPVTPHIHQMYNVTKNIPTHPDN